MEVDYFDFRELLVDHRHEHLVGLRAGEHAPVDVDRRRGVDAEPRAFGNAVANALAVLGGIQARIERRRVETQVGGMLLQVARLQRLLVREQPVVVLPELALIGGTVRRLARLERLRDESA